MIETRALWITAPKRTEIRDESVRASHDMVTIKSVYSGISTGTERLVFSGSVPVELYAQMKVPYQRGSFALPIKYGYSLVGEVVDGENDGRYVHVMHPHQDMAVIRREDITLLPKEMGAREAVMISNLETALTGVWDSKISIGDRAAVIGYGAIGALVTSVLKLMNIEVDVYEESQDRVSFIRGCRVNPDDNGYDVVFNCSSSGRGLQKGIEISGYEGRIVELSWYGTKDINLKLGGSFHTQRKQIISSQVSNIPSDRSGRWDHKRRKEVCIELIQKINLPMHEVSFHELDTEYGEILESKAHLVSVVKY